MLLLRECVETPARGAWSRRGEERKEGYGVSFISLLELRSSFGGKALNLVQIHLMDCIFLLKES